MEFGYGQISNNELLSTYFHYDNRGKYSDFFPSDSLIIVRKIKSITQINY